MDQHRKAQEAEAELKKARTQQLEYLTARARSLEDTLKRRSVVGVMETQRKLNISLGKCKASLLESTAGKASSSSLRGVWVNKAECIWRDILDQAVQFMEESRSPKQNYEFAQLVEGFELEPSEDKLKEIRKESANSKARVQTLAHFFIRSENPAIANKAHELA